MSVGEGEGGRLECINLAQDRDKWQAPLNRVMKVRFIKR
jgi:hypothetical protein